MGGKAILFLWTLAGALVAFCVVQLGRGRLEALKCADLPVLTEAALREAPCDARLLVKYSSYVSVPYELSTQSDILGMSFEGTSFTAWAPMRNGEGMPHFAGTYSQASGRFNAELHQASRGYPYYDHLEGQVHGPGLVNGVPCIYVELRFSWVGVFAKRGPLARKPLVHSGLFRSCLGQEVMP